MKQRIHDRVVGKTDTYSRNPPQKNKGGGYISRQHLEDETWTEREKVNIPITKDFYQYLFKVMSELAPYRQERAKEHDARLVFFDPTGKIETVRIGCTKSEAVTLMTQ